MINISNLKVKVESKEILKGVDLEIKRGEVLALMGPNGSGKSSLASAIIGNPKYEITNGKILFDNQNITSLSIDEKSKLGMMMAFQYPVALPGITVREMLLASLRQRGTKVSALELKKKIEEEAAKLKIDESLLNRSLNDGFSGGEKKKFEILQMKILEPKLLILDEIDSGLDIDALELIARYVNEEVKNRKMSVLVITHYQRLLKYLEPDKVAVMKDGFIVDNGGKEIVEKLENSGYKIYE
ncbi:MAG TPA: Fe-S cluster assembly ATPase SufC [Patescibacteria group bacterium]